LHERLDTVWTERGAIGRYKQWLGMLTRRWPEAVVLFQRVKKSQSFAEVAAALAMP
jgi:tRNA-dihydrouridine synthase C